MQGEEENTSLLAAILSKIACVPRDSLVGPSTFGSEVRNWRVIKMTITGRNWPWLKLPSRLRHYYQQLMLVTNVPCKTARSCEIHTAGAQSRTVTGSAGSDWTLMLYAGTLTGWDVMCLGVKCKPQAEPYLITRPYRSFQVREGTPGAEVTGNSCVPDTQRTEKREENWN